MRKSFEKKKMCNETALILDRLMNPLDDAIKDAAHAIHKQCPDSLRLCKLIEDNYAKVLKNGDYAGGMIPEDDEELCTLFDSVIEAVSDSERLVKQVNPRT